MAPPLPADSRPANESNAVQKMGFLTLLAFMYAFNSRVLDMGSIAFLHLPLILGVLSGGCALLSGAMFTAFRTRVGICYLALTGCFAAGVPFAYWRGGSAATLEDWLRKLVIWAFLVGLTVTYRECKLLLNTLVFAAASAALLGLIAAGQQAEGRLGLEYGRFSNPNYYALSLLMTLPLVWRLFWSGGRPGIARRLLAAGVGGVIGIPLVRTGSRMGMYALGVMILMILLRAPLLKKIETVLVVGLVIAIVVWVLPGYLRARYLTVSGADSDFAAGPESSAAGSTREREHLFRESVGITLQHPLFGVGLGNFSPYVNKSNQEMGYVKEAWLGTHNTYTQMSSEAGIPALLIFLGILVMSWRSLTPLIRVTRNDPRPEARDIYATAQATQVCLAAFCFSLFFIHLAYDMLLPMLMGIALVVSSTGERELKLLDARESQPALSGATEVRRVYGPQMAPAMRT
jgi:O-antigen ligase